MRGAEIDRAVLEVDDDPVDAGTGHDLHGLDRGDGRDRAEGRATVPPQLLETVERRGLCGGQGENSLIEQLVRDDRDKCAAYRAACFKRGQPKRHDSVATSLHRGRGFGFKGPVMIDRRGFLIAASGLVLSPALAEEAPPAL